MNAEDAIIVATYENLINCYTLKHSCAFLKECWLVNEGATFLSKPLSKMIYCDGNSQEIYTKQERAFINNVTTKVDYHCFQMSSNHGAIDCKIISVDFSFSSNTLYDSIKFIKIFNKAFDGFNVFLFVCSEGIHLGCSCIKNSEIGQDCIISPLITSKINWELLNYVFLYRNDSSDFYDYYTGLVDTILEIKNCFIQQPYEMYKTSYNNNDYNNDWQDTIRKLSDISNWYDVEQQNQFDENSDQIMFEDEIEWCLSELDYIKTSRINPLEMLFDAERKLEESNLEIKNSSPTNSVCQEDQREINDKFDLLDDPIALMKKLKAERI